MSRGRSMTHAESSRECMRRLRAARRQAGHCLDCDAPPAPDRVRCARHLRLAADGVARCEYRPCVERRRKWAKTIDGSFA